MQRKEGGSGGSAEGASPTAHATSGLERNIESILDQVHDLKRKLSAEQARQTHTSLQM